MFCLYSLTEHNKNAAPTAMVLACACLWQKTGNIPHQSLLGLHAGRGGSVRRMSAAQRAGTPSSRPAERAASGVFCGRGDDDLDTALAAPKMDSLLSQRPAAQTGLASSGVFQGREDDDMDALLASPAMERLLSQPPDSLGAETAVQQAFPAEPTARRSSGQQAQPRSSGRSGPVPGQQQAQVSAWDYPQQPPAQHQPGPRREVIDLTGED